MLSNRWRCFLINSCFVSRSVCFLQLPLFLLSSSSSTLFLTLLLTWIMFFSRFTVCRCVCSDTHSYSSCALLAVAEVFLLLCPRPRPAVTCLYVPLQLLHCSSNFPETSKSFLFVLLTGPNVTQDFRASPPAARQVAGGGPRQVWPRPPCIRQNLLPICPCMVWTAAEDSSSWHTCCRFTQHSAAVCSLIHTISVYCKNTNQLKLFVSLGWIFLFLSVTTLCWCSGSV